MRNGNLICIVSLPPKFQIMPTMKALGLGLSSLGSVLPKNEDVIKYSCRCDREKRDAEKFSFSPPLLWWVLLSPGIKN